MELLIKGLRELYYDLFGIFLPGILLIAGVSFFIETYPVLIWDVDFATFIHNHLPNDKIDSQQMVVKVIVLAVSSYFSGFILQHISKEGIWRSFISYRLLEFFLQLFENRINKLPFLKRVLKYPFTKRLFLLKPAKQSNVNESFQFLLSENAKRLTDDTQMSEELSNNWGALYLLCRCHISQNVESSLLGLFQSKYTFYRSISSAFAILFWTSLGCCLVSLLNTHWVHSLCYLFSSILMGSLSFMFNKNFEYFWLQWGNTLIAESYINLRK